MERYALYAEAALLKKRALTICTVSDSFTDSNKQLSSKERQEGLSQMVELAILVAESYNECLAK